jgi:hypothetical protein
LTQLPGVPARRSRRSAQRWSSSTGSRLAIGTGRIDLNNRIIDVIPTPGAHKDGLIFDPTIGSSLGDLMFPASQYRQRCRLCSLASSLNSGKKVIR